MTNRSVTTRDGRFARMLLLSSATAALLMAGCGGGATDPGTAAEPSRTGTITVSAAASLTDVFNELADEFSSRNPSVRVALNFGSSGQLAAQVREGAPVDVVAFANTETMESLLSDSLIDDPQVFATNRLAIVVPPGNPEGIDSLEDLDDMAAGNGIVALCTPDAPCGRYADAVLEGAGVSLDANRVTRAADARATLTAVSEGDADAALVYVTDAASAGDSVTTIDIPDARNVVAPYPIATLRSSRAGEIADAFVELTLSDAGRAALQRAGFGPP